MNEAIARLLTSAKFWTAIIGLVFETSTPAGAPVATSLPGPGES